MPVDPSKLNEIIQAAEKEYGEGTVLRGDQQPAVDRFPIDALELEYITGGGFPKGRRIRLYGPKSSGKSLTCWNLIKNAQADGQVCVYYNVEKQFTKEFAAAQGVDVEKLILVNGTVIEKIGLMMESFMEAAHVHVIDSLSSALALEELEAGMDEQRIAIRARTWARILSHIHERFDPTEHTLVMVDQVRVKIGSKGNDEPPGGRYIEHMSDMTLSYTPGSWLWYDKNGVLKDKNNTSKTTLSGTLEPDGIEINVKCVKSRVCRPLRSAKLKLDLNTFQFDQIDQYVKAAKHWGFVEGSSWITVPGQEKSLRPQEFRELLIHNDDLREQIRQKVLDEGAGMKYIGANDK